MARITSNGLGNVRRNVASAVPFVLMLLALRVPLVLAECSTAPTTQPTDIAVGDDPPGRHASIGADGSVGIYAAGRFVAVFDASTDSTRSGSRELPLGRFDAAGKSSDDQSSPSEPGAQVEDPPGRAPGPSAAADGSDSGDGDSTGETPVPQDSSGETPVPQGSSDGTPGPSDSAGGAPGPHSMPPEDEAAAWDAFFAWLDAQDFTGLPGTDPSVVPGLKSWQRGYRIQRNRADLGLAPWRRREKNAILPRSAQGRTDRRMSILIDGNTRVLCHGITGKAGAFHTAQCLAYGTKMVGGVVPGKGGTKSEHGLPVFDNAFDAVADTGADCSLIFVPAAAAADAACEAAAAGIRLVVLITEGIPTLDMVRCRKFLDDAGTLLIGPNCPGVITPGACKVGIMPGYIHKPPAADSKNIGLISRSGTLTYEAVWQCTTRGLAQTTCVGIGGDPVKGLNFIDLLERFEADPQTHAIILIGEIGGSDEEAAAAYVRQRVRKPVVAFIAGRTAPPGKRMGHAGAIISGGEGTAASKIAALKEAGIHVADSPADIGATAARALGIC